MKMSGSDYRTLSNALSAVSGEDVWQRYYFEHGLSEERYRWDMLRNSAGSDFIIGQYHKGLNDDHIDSALRKYFNHKLEK